MTTVASKKIRFSCECGRVSLVDHRFGGRKGRCPRCREVVKIPSAHPRARDPRPRRREDRRSGLGRIRSRVPRLALLSLLVGVGALIGTATLI